MSKASHSRVQRKLMSKSSVRSLQETAEEAKKKLEGATSNLDDLRAQISEAVQTLNQNQEMLGRMFNEQRVAIVQSLELVDAHQHVMRRVLHDSWNGLVRPTPLHPDDEAALVDDNLSGRGYLRVADQTIDYEWYFKQYNFTRALILAFREMRVFDGTDKPKKPAEVQSEPESEDIEFGGDYVPHQKHGNGEIDQGERQGHRQVDGP